LYGFASNEEKSLFEKLLDVSGVGGKTAMAVLCQFSVEEIIRMIKDGDSEGLTEVSGLGKKSAQKIILELQDKLDLGQVNELDLSQEAKHSESIGELKSALQGLGFRGVELTDRLDKGKELLKNDEDLTFEKLVEEVLKG
jgi:Holliday junction DNA helicase RuvA